MAKMGAMVLGAVVIGAVVIVSIYKPYWLRIAIYKTLVATRQLDTKLLVQSDVIGGQYTSFRGVYLSVQKDSRQIILAANQGIKTLAARQPLAVACVKRQKDRQEKQIWYDLNRDQKFLATVNSEFVADGLRDLASDRLALDTQVQAVQDINTGEVVYTLVIPCSR